jgi:16S rRNA (guanine1207-N2)-methyltransferase
VAQHYFDPDPGAASRPATVDLVLADVHLRLGTDRGMFSPDRVDLGTRVLLESVPAPPQRGRLLDVGCGYGPIALTLAARAPGAAVLGVDVNARAVALARANAAANGFGNARFHLIPPDGAPAGGPEDQEDPDGAEGATDAADPLAGPFDAIWSNPPIRVGKPVLHGLLRTWLGRLAPGAAAHLVVQRNLGSDSLQRWLDANGFPTERAASRAGFRVLRAVRA